MLLPHRTFMPNIRNENFVTCAKCVRACGLLWRAHNANARMTTATTTTIRRRRWRRKRRRWQCLLRLELHKYTRTFAHSLLLHYLVACFYFLCYAALLTKALTQTMKYVYIMWAGKKLFVFIFSSQHSLITSRCSKLFCCCCCCFNSLFSISFYVILCVVSTMSSLSHPAQLGSGLGNKLGPQFCVCFFFYVIIGRCALLRFHFYCPWPLAFFSSSASFFLSRFNRCDWM